MATEQLVLTPDRAEGPDSPGFGVWANVASDPFAGVAVIRPSGELVFANEGVVSMFFGEDNIVDDCPGQSLWELFPAEWVRERLELGRQVLESGEPLMLRTIWNGSQILTWMSCVDQESELSLEGRCLLTISRHCVSGGDSGQVLENSKHLVESKLMRLGDLEVLTRRELEVLALIGQGLSIRQIAAKLCRSDKTVQNHRDSIGNKLGLNNRVQVAQVAQRAGLQVSDVDRTRV